MSDLKKYSREVIELLEDPSMRLAWEEEGLLGELALGLEKAMKTAGVTQADIARKIGKTPQAISRALSGGQNLSVRTMLQIALALNQTIKVRVEPMEDVATATLPIKIVTPTLPILFNMKSYIAGAEKPFNITGLPMKPIATMGAGYE